MRMDWDGWGRALGSARVALAFKNGLVWMFGLMLCLGSAYVLIEAWIVPAVLLLFAYFLARAVWLAYHRDVRAPGN